MKTLEGALQDIAISDEVFEQLLKTEWFVAVQEETAEQAGIEQLKKASIKGQEYLMARSAPIGSTYACLKLENFIDYVVDNSNLGGIIFNPEESDIQMNQDIIFRLYIREQIMLHGDMALEICENKLSLFLKKQDYLGIWYFLIALGEVYLERRNRYIFYMAKIMEKWGNYDTAKKLYEQAIIACPDNYWLYYQLGLFYQRRHEKRKEKDTYLAAYKRYCFKSEDRTAVEGTIRYIMEALIVTEQHVIQCMAYKMIWKKEKKRYQESLDPYIYDEMENI